MGNLTNISSAIATVVTAVQQAGSAAFVDVLEYPSETFNGFPSVTIVPTDIVSDWATVNQNRRTYNFQVNIFVSVANLGNVSAEYVTMRALVDAVLDALDKAGVAGGALSAVCDFLEPVPMRWELVQSGTGDALMAPIVVKAQKDIALF